MKQYIPWPLKVGIKLALGVIGIDYKTLKRIGIVEYGRMENLEFSQAVFSRHVEMPTHDYHVKISGRLLELGPGDSITSGLLGLRARYSNIVLVDVGNFADLRPVVLNNLFETFQIPLPGITDSMNADEVLRQLTLHGISYLTKGLESVQALDSESINHSFSNSVLQHVHTDILPQLLEELGRVHVKGSLSSHSIRFDDHFSGGFINHVLPDRIMESQIIKAANLYTNRVPSTEFVRLFEAAGFILKKIRLDFFGHNAPAYVEYYSTHDIIGGISSRKVLRATLVIQKK